MHSIYINNKYKNYITLLLFVFTAGQVALKYVFGGNLITPFSILFHSIWMLLLHYGILQVIRKEQPHKLILVILYTQLATPLLLSHWLPNLYMSIVLSMPWLVIITSRFMLHVQRVNFYITLLILFLYSLISIKGFISYYNNPEISSIVFTGGVIYEEFFINLNTFAFSGILFLFYLAKIKYDIEHIGEDSWHSKWYVTLIAHLSHHLRTPLTQITTNFGMLEYAKTDEQRDLIKSRVNKGTEEMIYIINSFVSSSNIKNLGKDGLLISEVLEHFSEENKSQVSLQVNDKESSRIRGPEIVSLLLALYAFIEDYDDAPSKIHIELNSGQVIISTSNKSSVLKASMEDQEVNQNSKHDTEFHFMLKLLKESGWKITSVMNGTSFQYQVSRIANKWSKRASL